MSDEYARFADRLVAEGTIRDPWIDGAPRMSDTPMLLLPKTAHAVSRAAEEVAFAWHEVGRVVSEDESLLGSFFGLSPVEQALWRGSAGRWHGIARADVFLTPDGPQVAELNCDTPTGQAESVVLGAFALEDHPGAIDPNRQLQARFSSMIEASCATLLAGEARARKTCGIVYPTELTEDLPLVRIYRRWLTAHGWDVMLGSPFNLQAAGDDLTLFDQPISLMLRHYKTDWWCERQSAWSDETIVDAAPLSEPLAAALSAEIAGRCAIVNPFGAVLQQNKRSMALMWEHVHRFSARAQAAISAYVPPTFRAEQLHREQVLAQREDWVLKSDYGAEGDEVVLGAMVSDAEWEKCLSLARPGRWIVQRRFSPLAVRGEASANYGVWLVAGRAAGIYTRLQRGVTDAHAVSVATLIVEGDGAI